MFKFLCILAFLSLSAFAQHQHGDKPSVHGMLMMGKGKIYLSHLPMFHSPHDYQVLVEVEIDPASQKIYEDAMNTHPNETVFTLEPESFVLSDMMKPLQMFKGKIYLGHFERGGLVIAPEAKVRVARVIYLKKFDPNATHPAKLTYLLFGSEKGIYLAHKIEARPDFDQIVELPMNIDLLKRIQRLPCVEVTDVAPESGKELYLETSDLE